MFRRRNQVAALGLAIAGIAVAGCGGGHGSPAPPRLPHALGMRLQAEARAVEASLAGGDACAAAREASGLSRAVQVAVAAGQVPTALQAPLSGSARSLASRIHCAPPPVKPPHPPEHGHHGDNHGHGNGHGNGGDGGGD